MRVSKAIGPQLVNTSSRMQAYEHWGPASHGFFTLTHEWRISAGQPRIRESPSNNAWNSSWRIARRTGIMTQGFVHGEATMATHTYVPFRGHSRPHGRVKQKQTRETKDTKEYPQRSMCNSTPGRPSVATSEDALHGVLRHDVVSDVAVGVPPALKAHPHEEGKARHSTNSAKHENAARTPS